MKVNIEDIKALRLGIALNFVRYCDKEQVDEAINTFDEIVIENKKLTALNREYKSLSGELAKALIDALVYINQGCSKGDEALMEKYKDLLDRAKEKGAFIINPNEIELPKIELFPNATLLSETDDFIEQLARETILSHEESTNLVSSIKVNGSIEKAKEIYKKHGFRDLTEYKTRLVAATLL